MCTDRLRDALAGGAAGYPQHSVLVTGKRQLDLLLATLCLQTRVLCRLADGQEWPGDTSWAQAVLEKAGSEVVAAWPWLWGRNAPRCTTGSGRLAYPLCAAGTPQVKLDPKKPGLALVDGACASPSPQGEGKVLWGGGKQEMPEQVKHKRLTRKGHGEF